MRTFDFAPLYRTTVGFDRFATLLDGIANFDDAASTYPPYNIERLGDSEYRISMAVAGFTDAEITIEVKEHTLLVKGQKAADDTERAYLHRGIAARNFERRFQLADYVEVKNADLRDGLLHIGLVRNVPEALKPRTIPVGKSEAPRQLEAAE